MQVGPQHGNVHRFDRVKHVMMVVPVNGDVNEAEYVTQEHREKRSEIMPLSSVRNFELENHDGEDDGKNTVAKSFQTIFTHMEFLRDTPKLART